MAMYLDITNITVVNNQSIILSVTWFQAPSGGSAYVIEVLTYPLADTGTTVDYILQQLTIRARQLDLAAVNQSALTAGLAAYMNVRTLLT